MSTIFEYNGISIQTDEGYIPQQGIGLNGVPIRSTITPVSYGDGANMWAQNLDARVITVSGQVVGADAVEYRVLLNALIQALEPGEEHDLTITLWDNTVKQIPAYVLQQPQTIEQSGRVDFNDIDVQFFCENPNYLSTTLHSATLGLAELSGFNFPFDFPFDFGRTGENIVVCNNAGNKNTIPTYSIDMGGGITNPTIRNQTTGVQFQLTRTFAADDVVTVSFDRKLVTVTLNGSQNIFTDFVGNFPELEPGDNIISFTSTLFDADAEAIVTWRDAYSYL
jgi:phage-related protein